MKKLLFIILLFVSLHVSAATTTYILTGADVNGNQHNSTNWASISATGGIGNNLGGSNFISSLVFTNVSAITNIATMSPDFTKTISLITTNNAFQVLGYGGKDSSGKDVNWCSIAYTNSAGAGAAFVTNITVPVNTHVIGPATLNLTNWTEILYMYWPPNGPTNAFITPCW